MIINLSHSDLCLKPAKIKSLNLKGAKMKSVLLIFLLLIFLLDPDISLPESQDDDNNNTKSDETCEDCEESDEVYEDCEESDEDYEDHEESDEDCEDCDCCPMCLRCCFYAGRVGCKTKYYRISCLQKDLPAFTSKPPTIDLKLDTNSSISRHKQVHQVSHDLHLQPISNEMLTYEDNEETMKEEDKTILDVTENIENCNSEQNNNDNVPETFLSNSVELNVEPMHSNIKDMDDEPIENAENKDENCDITDTPDLNELESFSDMSWEENNTTPS